VVRDSTTGLHAVILGGAGADSVFAEGVEVGKHLTILGNAGDDQIKLDADTSVGGHLKLEGGAGLDELDDDSSIAGRTFLRNIEETAADIVASQFGFVDEMVDDLRADLDELCAAGAP
jgi:hypothetical protein